MTRWLETAGRRIAGSRRLRRVAARAIALYIRSVHALTFWRTEGAEHKAAAVAGGGGLVCAVWHGRILLFFPERPRGRPAAALTSANRDGALVRDVCAAFDVAVVRGSSRDPRKPAQDKGGARALLEAAGRIERDGAIFVVTPDGPRGPRMRAAPGAVVMAAMSGAPILPFAYATRFGVTLRGWDRFLIPFPFGPGARVYMPAIAPPDPGDPAAVEATRRALETALNAATARADALAGRAPVAPDAA